MPPLVTVLLGSFSVLALVIFYITSLDVAENLSPQGCRMSWMSPSYVLQSQFDISWTPLARRYSLWLYREVGWDPVNPTGLPVLFIPGNAGSSHQVRSIASSAARQFYQSPGVIAPDFETSTLKPLDFYAVEFNEDLSAFHGSTLASQITYTATAVSYILSLYPANTQIILMGHSMGGIVATSILPSDNVSSIITMSTPYTLPPARFDSRIDDIYHHVQRVLETDSTPIVSLCGGATDMMIPSESCILNMDTEFNSRKTVFTSALEGAWTGVGHREMVWCHQVRWRVARTALELGAMTTPTGRVTVLDKWLRDGHTLPPKESSERTLDLTDEKYQLLGEGEHLLLSNPVDSKIYLLPVPNVVPGAYVFTIFVSRGIIPPISSQNPLPLSVSIFDCRSTTIELLSRCHPLKPSTLKLIPNPGPGIIFPVPNEGSDESEGVVLYEAILDPAVDENRWIGIKIEGADSRGWVVGGFSDKTIVLYDVGTLSSLFTVTSVDLPNGDPLRISISFPNLISNALVVYRIIPKLSSGFSWNEHGVTPLVMLTSHTTETHYFPLLGKPGRRVLLHTHLPAPFIPQNTHLLKGLHFTIYSTPENIHLLTGFDITVDWSATFGRWTSRYLNTLASWAAGLSALILFNALGHSDDGGPAPTMQQSFKNYGRLLVRWLLPASFFLSFIPLSEKYYLGNGGEPFFAIIAPIVLCLASGLLCISWWILSLLIWMINGSVRFLLGRRREKTGAQRGTLLSMAIIFVFIFLFVPWQVAFLGAWLLLLYTCGSSSQADAFPRSPLTPSVAGVPPVPRMRNDESRDEQLGPGSPHKAFIDHVGTKQDNFNLNMHILLLMTWLLPLVAPILAVWVRTLITAGLTTPFDGDHFFPNVAPYLILVDFASWTSGALLLRPSWFERISVRWLFAVVSGTAFLAGSRWPYKVLDVTTLAISILVASRIGRRYWGGLPWIPAANNDKRG